MKISIITVVFNAEDTIADCVTSVLEQDHPDIEYLIIDGGSTDNTMVRLAPFRNRIATVVSEPDRGIYDAINKGIALAKGDVVGLLNADDLLASSDIISKVAQAFEHNEIDAVYGDLDYVSRQRTDRVIRKWRSGPAGPLDVKLGWMPAHPTLYVKREIFRRYGNYELGFSSAGDYEMILRLFYRYRIKGFFLNELMVRMRVGGVSNATIRHRFEIFECDVMAAKRNRLPFPMLTVIFKKLRKIGQFF